MEQYDVLIVGAGAAGIAAAHAAASGCSVLLTDRKPQAGGILLQCAHRGFGQGQTGFAYAEALRNGLPSSVHTMFGATVTAVSPDRTAVLCGKDSGEITVAFRQLILASGCMEIPFGALPIAGTRPAGIYTAGQMQEMMNLRGFRPKGPAVILGSGDLGLIMASQLAEAGLPVTLVEQRDTCGGLARNRTRLSHPRISLICAATIRAVAGERHLESVTLSDGRRLPCRTLLIAAGLRPDRTLIRELGSPGWLHLCGNCRTVHPMVEAVIQEGTQAGLAACRNIRGGL